MSGPGGRIATVIRGSTGPEGLHRRVAPVAHIGAVVALVVAPVALVCAAIEVAAAGGDAFGLGLTGALAGVGGLLVVRRTRLAPRASAATTMSVTVGVSLVALALLAMPYLWVSAAGGVDGAVFEGAAGLTTTSATVLTDPAVLGGGMVLWRAGTQWLGGLALVVLVVEVFPLLGTGGLDPDGGVATRSARRIAPRFGAALRRLIGVYVALTVAIGIGYGLAGLGAADAVALAMSTASTGGFSPRPGSLATFDSGAVEAVAAAGMFCAGLSLPLMWRATVGRDPWALGRSVELRAYVAVVAIVATLVWAWNGAAVDGVGPALVLATSAASTTGMLEGTLSSLSSGTGALVLLVIGIGSMAASLGGGFGLVRVLAVFGFVRRELTRQLHPDARPPVRIGASVLSEPMTNRLVGSISLSLGFLVAATVILTEFDPAPDAGTAMVDAVSIGLTSLAGGGPALVAGAELTWPAGLDPVGRLTAVVLMVVGRVDIYPVLVVAATVGAWRPRPPPPPASSPRPR